jgi:hypothetical protein
MDRARYERVRDNLLATAADIEKAKRGPYTVGDLDVLRNFKAVGERVGRPPKEIALTYLLKHIDSICTIVRRPDVDDPEPMLTRFADVLNYVKLLFALLVEEKGETNE